MEILRIQPPQSETDTLFIVNWPHGTYEQLSKESHAWPDDTLEQVVGEYAPVKITIKLKK